MVNEISLLDCTLRDGGYVNDWRFGHDSAIMIAQRLVDAGVDFLEIGFLDERVVADNDRTIQPNISAFNSMFNGFNKKHTKIIAMIDYGTCSIENLVPRKDTFIDGIRIIFKKPKMKGAVAFAKEVMGLGFDVFLQMVSITAYEDQDILDFAKDVNQVNPFAVSIVDTYGLLHKNDLLHYFHILDRNLNEGIHLGYHSHNNFQLAYSNCIEYISRKTRRNLLVDGTVYGMGKSAGNVPLELLAMYLNENFEKNYNMGQILETLDTEIMRVYRKKPWGYTLKFFLSASNDCHPNYVSFLLEKNMLSVDSINEILHNIPKEKKLDYNQKLIEEMYYSFQKKFNVGEGSITVLKKNLSGKNILVVGPGRTSVDPIVKEYILNENPIVMSVNSIFDSELTDYLFISNSKRYSMLSNRLSNPEYAGIDVIATSNITSVGRQFDFVIDYGMMCDENHSTDNSLIMALSMLKNIDVNIIMAGFDGFDAKSANYSNAYFENPMSPEAIEKTNDTVSNFVREYRKTKPLTFLTKSIYDL